MKKLIAILAMVALVSGAAFAQVGANVIGTVNVIESGHTNDDGEDTVGGSAGMDRIRFQGTGETDDGKFGGFIRLDLMHWSGDHIGEGLAWWKPIQQFKLSIGGNSDGIWGKEGVTGWMFYQMITDTDTTFGGENVWGGGFGAGFNTRHVFYQGFQSEGLLFDIKPVDFIGINVALPYFSPGQITNILKGVHAQLDVNLDFGNIAVTYAGDAGASSNGKLFAFFSLNAIDNLGLDVGFSFTLPGEDEVMAPLGIGLGFKFDVSDAFGIKARVATALAGDDGNFGLLFDLLPYFALNDNLKIFASAGIAMVSPDGGDLQLAWHVNPYVEIGNEWGPTFYAGFKLEGDNAEGSKVKWSVPVAIGISF